MRRLIVSALLFIPAVSFAQQPSSARTVSPGMTRSQVVAALGEPSTARTASEYSYLFYPNACGRACGMNDLVILRGDSVVDAIFRSPDRHYTGVSSSPEPVVPRTTAKPKRKPLVAHKAAKDSAAKPAKASDKAATPAPKMKPPKEANDARPSIPANPTPMKPAPTKAPATKPAPQPQ
jgi:hypothetical protein